MIERNRDTRPSLAWQVMDCRKLEYADETFDLIIDKSTADALLCGSKAFKNLAITLREC